MRTRAARDGRRAPVRRGFGAAMVALGLALAARPGAAQPAQPDAPAVRDSSRWGDFVHEVSRPLTWAEPLGYTVYDQVQDNPEAWGSDADGLGRRLAAHTGRTAISLTVRHGTAALLDAPAHPVRCPTAGGGARLLAAALEPVADRGCDGRVRVAVPRIAARVASGFAPLAWHHPDYTAGKAAQEVATGFASSAVLNVLKVLVFGK